MAEAPAAFDPAEAAELTGTRAQDVASMVAGGPVLAGTQFVVPVAAAKATALGGRLACRAAGPAGRPTARRRRSSPDPGSR